jgi:hypothetical protein
MPRTNSKFFLPKIRSKKFRVIRDPPTVAQAMVYLLLVSMRGSDSRFFCFPRDGEILSFSGDHGAANSSKNNRSSFPFFPVPRNFDSCLRPPPTLSKKIQTCPIPGSGWKGLDPTCNGRCGKEKRNIPGRYAIPTFTWIRR